MSSIASARNMVVAFIALGAMLLSFDMRSEAALRPLPSILRAISDEVGMLSVPEGQALAQMIADVQRENGVEIIVLIAETTVPEKP